MRKIQNSNEIRIDTILDGRLMRIRHSRIALTLICALLVCLIGAIPSAAQQVTASITGQHRPDWCGHSWGQGYRN